MTLFFVLIILCSLTASSFICVRLIKKRSQKQVIFCVLLMNTIILSGASYILYKIDARTFHKEIDGLFNSLGITSLLFFIPIITWINIITMKWKAN
ncbi:hypothetical protein A3781_15045 [Bacillus badius]|nr:hypothetical protein A3781_15045 [Bacillus badius]